MRPAPPGVRKATVGVHEATDALRDAMDANGFTGWSASYEPAPKTGLIYTVRVTSRKPTRREREAAGGRQGSTATGRIN